MMMSLTRFYIPLLIVIASVGCSTNHDRVLEPNEDSTSIATNKYVEPTDEELPRMGPGPHDAELYTNVIEVHVDESGIISDEGKELTIEDLVNRITEQPKIQDVQLNIVAPSGTPMRVVTRIQREISDAVPELERIWVIVQPSKAGG